MEKRCFTVYFPTSPGFIPYSSLKRLVKYEGVVKPTSYATSDIFFSVVSSSCFALARRAFRSRSTTEYPVSAFTLR